MAEEKIRPTKKQRELLGFIESFIATKGYSPSYREIMQGQGYNSVATVALHVNNLIKRGHLAKRENAARSLEVVTVMNSSPKEGIAAIKPGQEKWLVQKVDHFFSIAETDQRPTQAIVDNLYVLTGALKVLGLEEASRSFLPRLKKLKTNVR